ncbi:MAG: LysE family transporter [Candidatus Dadabacteria bacterium]|jgi:threonine/homoserine/homoserine lactone efflux protein|nr:LysE family transporter [Candidatus Dadabacteria bacterium]
MDLAYFIKGIVIGIVITAPIGPVGALVVQRTINRGRGAGILSGLGASVGDAVYGIVVAFSLTFVSDFLMSHEVWVHIIGGVILLVFGIRVYFSRPRPLEPGKAGRSHFGNFGSALLLTLSNPMVILSILALFAILGIAEPADYYRTASILVAGIFVGCFVLWTALCYFISHLRGRLSEKSLIIINKITGILILVCGAYAFLSLIKLPPA